MAVDATSPSADHRLVTVALVNESANTQTFNVQVGGFRAGSMAQWWRTQSNAAIARQPDPTVSADLVTVTLPARSIGMLVVPAAAGIDAGTGTDAGSGSSDGGAGSGGSNAGADGGSGGGTGVENSVTSTCAAAGTGAPSLLLLVLILVSLHRRQS
jgi:hypothetical protein